MLDHVVFGAPNETQRLGSLRNTNASFPRAHDNVAKCILRLRRGAYPVLSQQFCINETCRPLVVQGQLADTPSLGDCALYGLLAMADRTLRPHPSQPTAAQAMHVWAVQRTLAGILGPWETSGELLYLACMFPKTVVTLGLHLGIYRTFVQVIDGTEYVVAERDHPWQGGPHAVLLQMLNNYTVYMPVETKKRVPRLYPKATIHRCHQKKCPPLCTRFWV